MIFDHVDAIAPPIMGLSSGVKRLAARASSCTAAPPATAPKA